MAPLARVHRLHLHLSILSYYYSALVLKTLSHWIVHPSCGFSNGAPALRSSQMRINKDWSIFILGEHSYPVGGRSGGERRPQVHSKSSVGSTRGSKENVARVLARAGTNMTLACPGLTPTSYVYLVEWKCIGCKCTGQCIRNKYRGSLSSIYEFWKIALDYQPKPNIYLFSKIDK